MIQAADAAANGIKAAPNALVVLDMTNRVAPRVSAASNKVYVPVILVSINFCSLWVTICGLCNEVV